MNGLDHESGAPEGISRRRLVRYVGVGATLAAAGPLVAGGRAGAEEAQTAGSGARAGDGSRAWRAGDHHVHSEYSGEFDTSTDPPTFHKGTDGIYPIATNALMARQFGLSWMMCADHGGPTHSKVNLEQAYPDLLRSRVLVPEVLQFWGMEFDAPALDHHTLM
ncbi:phosphoesterase, partial [Streptomyces aculeolatus]